MSGKFRGFFIRVDERDAKVSDEFHDFLAKVDERDAKVGLEPLGSYLPTLKVMHGLKARGEHSTLVCAMAESDTQMHGEISSGCS